MTVNVKRTKRFTEDEAFYRNGLYMASIVYLLKDTKLKKINNVFRANNELVV